MERISSRIEEFRLDTFQKPVSCKNGIIIKIVASRSVSPTALVGVT